MNLVPPTNDRHMRLVTDPPAEPYRFKLETWLKLAEVWGAETANVLCDVDVTPAPPEDEAA